MTQIILSDAEQAKLKRFTEELSKNEYLQRRLREQPQAVLQEFGLDRLRAALSAGVGMLVPDPVVLAGEAQRSASHTDWYRMLITRMGTRITTRTAGVPIIKSPTGVEP